MKDEHDNLRKRTAGIVYAKVARAIKTVFYALDVVNQGMQEKQPITVRCVDMSSPGFWDEESASGFVHTKPRSSKTLWFVIPFDQSSY